MFYSHGMKPFVDLIFLILFLNLTSTTCDKVTNACNFTLAGFGDTITVLTNATTGSSIHILSAYRAIQETNKTEKALQSTEPVLYLQTNSSYFALQYRSDNTTAYWEIIVTACLVAEKVAELHFAFSDDIYSNCLPERVTIKIDPTIPDFVSMTTSTVDIDLMKCQARNGYLRVHNIKFSNAQNCVPFTCGLFRLYLQAESNKIDITHIRNETFSVVSGTVIQASLEKVEDVDYNLEIYCIDESYISAKPFDVLNFLVDNTIQLPKSKVYYMSRQNYIFRSSDLQACKDASLYNTKVPFKNTTNTKKGSQILSFSSSTINSQTLQRNVTSKFVSTMMKSLDKDQETTYGLSTTRFRIRESRKTSVLTSLVANQTVPYLNTEPQTNKMDDTLYHFTALSSTWQISLASISSRTPRTVAEKTHTDVFSTAEIQLSTNTEVPVSKLSAYLNSQSSIDSFFRDPFKAAVVAIISCVAMLSVTYFIVRRIFQNTSITPE